MHNNVRAIKTQLMIDYLVDLEDVATFAALIGSNESRVADVCVCCRVLNAIGCDLYADARGRFFDGLEGCACHCRACGEHDSECECPEGPVLADAAEGMSG